MPEIKAKNIKEEIAKSLSNNGVNADNVTMFFSKGQKETDVFIKIFQKQMEIMNSCSGATAKVFLYFLQCAVYGNYVEADLKTIASVINLSLASVKRGLNELKELDVLITDKDTNDKRRNSYYINPLNAWKGNPGDRKKALNKFGKTLELPFNSPAMLKVVEDKERGIIT
jgi:predicted transcriptional regulator